jgi:hypothetical protein
MADHNATKGDDLYREQNFGMTRRMNFGMTKKEPNSK